MIDKDHILAYMLTDLMRLRKDGDLMFYSYYVEKLGDDPIGAIKQFIESHDVATPFSDFKFKLHESGGLYVVRKKKTIHKNISEPTYKWVNINTVSRD